MQIEIHKSNIHEVIRMYKVLLAITCAYVSPSNSSVKLITWQFLLLRLLQCEPHPHTPTNHSHFGLPPIILTPRREHQLPCGRGRT
jgi:hypothetical protein